MSILVRSTVAIAAVVWILWGQDWVQLRSAFKKLNLWYFGLALGTFLLCQVLIGCRWWILLRSQSVVIELKPALRLHFLGLFYNNFMPGSVGGDLLKAWYVTKHTHKRFEAALSVFVDRIIGFLGMLCIAALCYFLFMRGSGALASGPAQEGSLATIKAAAPYVLIAAVVLAAALLVAMLFGRGRRILRGIWQSARFHSVNLGRKLVTAAGIYCRNPVVLIGTLLLTIAVQAMVITAFWLLGTSLDMDAAARYYYVFFPLVWVIGAIPVSIAGIGVLEGGLIELFTRFTGAKAEQVLALALCQRVVWVLASFPGAAIHMFGAHLPKEFFVDEESPME